MLTVTFTLATGRMTRLTALVFIITLMVPSMRASGQKINNMDMAKRPGLTMPAMRVIIKKAKSMVSEYFTGLTDLPTTALL